MLDAAISKAYSFTRETSVGVARLRRWPSGPPEVLCGCEGFEWQGQVGGWFCRARRREVARVAREGAIRRAGCMVGGREVNWVYGEVLGVLNCGFSHREWARKLIEDLIVGSAPEVRISGEEMRNLAARGKAAA